ncbi:MAG: IS1595 family transposase [Parcubacteria group bacterium]|jgi:transposase-like protein
MDIIELQKQFSTQHKCEVFLRRMRWPNGVTCPKCGAQHPYWLQDRNLWECSACSYQFSVTAGTIFHRSRTPLGKWFIAVWLMVESKKGVSAKQIERTIGVTYKTAWRIAMQIRQAMRPGYGFEDKLAGIVEVDEAYIGGHHPGKRGRGAFGKTAVVGIKERGGAIAAQAVPNLKAETLAPLLNAFVRTDAELLCTDEFPPYAIAAKGYRHATVTHARTYVNGNVHVMGVESFWSLFKRAIIGTYHRISAKYLQAYLNEFVFRFNNRHNPAIFDAVLANC